MRLYFNCPVKNEIFSSTDFSLEKDYAVMANTEGGRELQGNVCLNSPCPLCGEKHIYEVKDVMCGLQGGKNE